MTTPTTTDPVPTCDECGIAVDALDGVATDAGLVFCGNYRGNGCGDRYLALGEWAKGLNRTSALAALDAYVTTLYESPEIQTDTEDAIVDLIADLLYLADHYRTEGYGDVTATAEAILARVANYRAEGI